MYRHATPYSGIVTIDVDPHHDHTQHVIGKSFGHGRETTSHNPAKGLCLSCIRSRGEMVGGEEHLGKRTPV
jgi:hypothetical protein